MFERHGGNGGRTCVTSGYCLHAIVARELLAAHLVSGTARHCRQHGSRRRHLRSVLGQLDCLRLKALDAPVRLALRNRSESETSLFFMHSHARGLRFTYIVTCSGAACVPTTRAQPFDGSDL